MHRHIALVMLSYSFLAVMRSQAIEDRPTLPEMHRQVLLALLIDLAEHWAHVKQSFAPGLFTYLLDRAPPPGRPLTK